jgi:coenzyme F420 hydrogenase subunit delta
MLGEIARKKTIVLGCGNPLFGDDGFGPAVIERLETQGGVPETVALLDVGTGIKDFLLDLLLSPVKPERIFLIDTVYLPGYEPGEVFEVEVSSLKDGSSGGGVFHQFPSLRQLKEWGSLPGVALRLVAVQAGRIPEAVRPGLSPKVRKAVEKVCDWLMDEIGRT